MFSCEYPTSILLYVDILFHWKLLEPSTIIQGNKP